MNLNLKPSTYYLRPNRGFALLIAVIISAIIIAVGISIVNATLQQIILASTVRSSLESFYIADGGAECALYWDNIRGNYNVSSSFVPSSLPSEIECSGHKINVESREPVNFWISDNDSTKINLPCANVILATKFVDTNTDKIVLDSYGYNTCDPANQRRVDRAIEVKYSRYK